MRRRRSEAEDITPAGAALPITARTGRGAFGDHSTEILQILEQAPELTGDPAPSGDDAMIATLQRELATPPPSVPALVDTAYAPAASTGTDALSLPPLPAPRPDPVPVTTVPTPTPVLAATPAPVPAGGELPTAVERLAATMAAVDLDAIDMDVLARLDIGPQHLEDLKVMRAYVKTAHLEARALADEVADLRRLALDNNRDVNNVMTLLLKAQETSTRHTVDAMSVTGELRTAIANHTQSLRRALDRMTTYRRNG